MQEHTQAPKAAITGLWDTVRSHQHSTDCASVIVSFTPTGAAALLRQPLDELANATIPLQDLLPRSSSLHTLSERLAEVSDHTHRFQAIEQELRSSLDVSRQDQQIAEAIAHFEGSETPLSIVALARQLGLSQSALERRFRRLIGTTPQRFASLVRLKRVLQYRESGLDMTTIAHAAGYYDQSHFIKDFQRFAGSTPSAYFRA